MVERLELETHHNTLTNGGIAAGGFDHNHKVLRQRWYQATTKLMSTDNLHELVDFAARQIVENIETQMKAHPNGIDPKKIFMNGTLNVGTSFMLNDRLEFGDPEQVKIMNWIEIIFGNFNGFFLVNLWPAMFPDWMIRKDIPRKILELLVPKAYTSRDIIIGKFLPFVMKKLKQHEKNIGTS